MITENTEFNSCVFSRKHGEFLHGDLTDKIIKIAIEIHKKLGPGFIEKIYETALCYELKKTKIKYERQKEIKVQYEEIMLGHQRIDVLVDNKVLIDLKCVSELSNIHQAQIISYLKASQKRVGLLLNFAKPKLEIKRIMN